VPAAGEQTVLVQTSYGLVPIGWVQSALRVLHDAPNQRDGAPRAWIRFDERRRVEAREPEMPGQGVPTWEQVRRRRYEPWPPELSGRLVVDNVGDPAGHVAHIVRTVAAEAGQDRRQRLR
jgi:hypothetical protein